MKDAVAHLPGRSIKHTRFTAQIIAILKKDEAGLPISQLDHSFPVALPSLR
jgi:hypothetical protein